MRQSKELTKFYHAVLKWVQTGEEPRFIEFNKSAGLCHNLYAYCVGNNIVGSHFPRLKIEMRRQFVTANLDSNFPFDEAVHYVNDACEGKLYENPARIEWLTTHSK